MSNLARWEPFRELVTLREAMDRLFDESFVRPSRTLSRAQEQTLAVDIYETDEDIKIRATVPNVDPDDLDITITGEQLVIRGETKREQEIEEENYICRERFRGAFSRTLPLPTDVVAEDAEAEFENGVLTLTLPKAEEVKPKAIEVKAK